MWSTEGIMRIVSAILFAGIGYLLSSKIPAPRKVFSWVVFILGILLSNYVMVSTLIFGFGTTGIYFNNSLQGLGAGILCGFIVRGKAQVL
jgi:hypothetical protein